MRKESDSVVVPGGVMVMATGPAVVVEALGDGRFASRWGDTFENTGVYKNAQEAFEAARIDVIVPKPRKPKPDNYREG